jgi:malonyl-CoA O-methyltransferase
MNLQMPRLEKQKLLENFNRAATAYDDISVLQKYTGEELIDRLQVIRLDPDLIMDLGSGLGRSARKLSELYKAAQVIQLDIAQDMLKTARTVPTARQSYLCADAEALPIKSQSIDLAFSNLMLQWCPDPGRLLADIVRCLKPGGLFIFATLGPDTLRELKESWGAVDDGIHVNTFIDMHDLGDALLVSGFAEPVMETDSIIITYETVTELMHDLKSLGAGNVNHARRKTLTGKLRLMNMFKEYEKRRKDGRLPASHEVIYGHAWLPGGNTLQSKKEFTISLEALKNSLKRITSRNK